LEWEFQSARAKDRDPFCSSVGVRAVRTSHVKLGSRDRTARAWAGTDMSWRTSRRKTHLPARPRRGEHTGGASRSQFQASVLRSLSLPAETDSCDRAPSRSPLSLCRSALAGRADRLCSRASWERRFSPRLTSRPSVGATATPAAISGAAGVATISIATLPTAWPLDRTRTSRPLRGVGIAGTTVGMVGPAPVLFEMRPTPRVLLSPGPPHQLQDGPTVAVVADGWIHLRLAEGRTRCMARHTSGRNRSMIG
jgi:hypothetical protein